jgi:hypothetical protein
MKRFAVAATLLVVLLSGVVVAHAARRDDDASLTSQTPAVTATGALHGAAGWHYRHNQPTHWHSSMLNH